MLGGLLVFTIGLILLVIEIIFAVGAWFDLLASLLFLSGIAIALYGVLIGIRARKSAENQLTDPLENSAVGTTSQLAQDGELLPPVPSVTERPTELTERQDSSQPEE
jgi:hypothetical protein